jgi:uncharacterized protein (TIGR02145 family)
MGGNGGPHSGQTVSSTGVSGLTATLAAGNFAIGADSLSYIITGTPGTSGTASFALNIGGQSCTLERCSAPANCWAKVSATDTLYFMCHNLASANPCADPFSPSWEINGGYWQWGRKGPNATQWLNTNTANFAHGPTGTGAGETNEGNISGWSQTAAPNGSWQDGMKTVNDPCPDGFRVPTKAQWDGVVANNTQSIVGTWSNNSNNFSTGRFFGPALMLPAAGNRNSADGTLNQRGNFGYYWSSTASVTAGNARCQFLTSVGNLMLDSSRRVGHSVRCAAE